MTQTHGVSHDPTELLRLAAAGEPRAWAEIIRRYTPVLRSRICRYRLQEADAHDVAQTTWLRLAENIHRLHTPTHLAGWLATVVTHECESVARGHRRTLLAETRVLAIRDPDPGPEQRAVDHALHCALHQVLRDALADLPPRRRELLLALFDDDRKPYAAIAHDLGLAVGSIGPTRARSLRDLRQALEHSGVAA